MDEVAGTGYGAGQSGQSVAAFGIERGQRSAQLFAWKKRFIPSDRLFPQTSANRPGT
jgi:hypothetical protein